MSAIKTRQVQRYLRRNRGSIAIMLRRGSDVAAFRRKLRELLKEEGAK